MNLLPRPTVDIELNVLPEAQEAKTNALAAAALIGKVVDQAGNSRAVEAMTELKRVIKATEDSRKKIKEPVLDLSRKIDTVAKGFVNELEDEYNRVASASANFQALELARIRAEQAAENQRLAEAERARQAELAAAQTHDERDEVNDKFDRQAAAQPPQVFQPSRPKGQVVREDWDITITDVHMLYRAHPNCVDLSPRRSEIRQLLDMRVEVRGVTAKKVVKTGVALR